MIKAVLPGMRARRNGAIVNISSIGARITPAGSGYYAAAKAALEGMSGSLRKELQPLGITVTAVEPGAFRTDFAGRSLAPVRRRRSTITPSTAGKRRKENDTVHGTQPGDPAKAAEAIITAVDPRSRRRCCCSAPTRCTALTAVLDAERDELQRWKELSTGTDFGG